MGRYFQNQRHASVRRGGHDGPWAGIFLLLGLLWMLGPPSGALGADGALSWEGGRAEAMRPMDERIRRVIFPDAPSAGPPQIPAVATPRLDAPSSGGALSDPVMSGAPETRLGPAGGDLLLRVGPQRYASGIGYGFKPFDPFQSGGPMDPLYGGRIVPGAYMSYRLGEAARLDTLYVFDGDPNDPSDFAFEPEDAGYQVQMKTHAGVWDLAIHYAEARQDKTDYQGLENGLVTPETAVIPVRWRLLAAGISGELGGIGVHAEGGRAWLSMDKQPEHTVKDDFARDHSRFLVGIDYTFENKLYLVLEYYQEGQGRASAEDYTYNERMAYLNEERQAIGRDNLFVGARFPITRMTSLELYNIINANDPSVIVNPWLVWSAGEDVNVSLSAQIPVGREDSALKDAKPAAYGRIQINF